MRKYFSSIMSWLFGVVLGVSLALGSVALAGSGDRLVVMMKAIGFRISSDNIQPLIGFGYNGTNATVGTPFLWMKGAGNNQTRMYVYWNTTTTGNRPTIVWSAPKNSGM